MTEKPSRPNIVELSGEPLSPSDATRVARGQANVRLGGRARAAVSASRAALTKRMGAGRPIYGVNTGFGSLSKKLIPPAELGELQRNLVRSHAAGVGEPLSPELVRTTMVLLAASLARARSGVRPELIDSVCEFLNRGVTPWVPSLGSVGASGDLAPLAHIALALIGEGHVMGDSAEKIDTPGALARAQIKPVVLEAKEGLALINGTHLMAAMGCAVVDEFASLFGAAVAAAGLSIDACRGTDAFLDERVYVARQQPGPSRVASSLRALLAGSGIIPSHALNDSRVQDPYSLRCVAPVLGSAWDAFQHVREIVSLECGAVTDNPLVFEREGECDVVSAGNFHGMPLAIPLDTMAIAVSHVAGISERRTFYMLAAPDAEMQLTAYLSPRPGLHSGLMIAQYTAAALCNEIVGLATPASVSNFVTSAGIEDYNSFGPRAGAKALRAIDLARRVVAIELICAAQGVEAHRPLRTGDILEQVLAIVREAVEPYTSDRPVSEDIERVAARIKDGAFDGLVD